MPNCCAFCEFCLGVPGAEQEYDDWAEARLEQTNHETEGAYCDEKFIRVTGICAELSSHVSAVGGRNYHLPYVCCFGLRLGQR